jgi:hypothetical protein
VVRKGRIENTRVVYRDVWSDKEEIKDGSRRTRVVSWFGDGL